MSKHHHRQAATAPSGSAGVKTTPQPATASGEKGRKPQLVSADEIRIHAYRKWEHAGKPAGDGMQFWLEAEQELSQGK